MAGKIILLSRVYKQIKVSISGYCNNEDVSRIKQPR